MIPMKKSERSYRAFLQDSSRWDHYAPRPSDIVIGTQAKCGTTWMQRIVSLLVFQSPEPCPVMGISPWIDSAFHMPLDAILAIIDAQTYRRFLKSHLPFDGLPNYDEVRYIHVGRDPRDACMSLFNHWSAFVPFAFDQLDAATPAELGPVPRTPDDLRSFWRRWFTRVYCPACRMAIRTCPSSASRRVTARAAAHKSPARALQRSQDRSRRGDAPDRGVSGNRLSRRALAPPRRGRLVRSDEARRCDPDGGRSAWFEGGSDRFLFKGSNGRWRDELSADDWALADKLIERFPPGLRSWVQNGRLGAGDPVNSPD